MSITGSPTVSDINRYRLKQVQDYVDKMRRKREQEDRLFDELLKSTALPVLWPEVFEHGSTRQIEWVGRPEFLRMRIVRGDGSARDFSRDQIPDDIFAIIAPPHLKSIARRAMDSHASRVAQRK